MFPSTLVVWVRFSGYMYKKSVLKAIGESIGWIVKIDDNTDNRTIGQFARLAVCFNLTKPLVLKISVENHTQRVEYESLPYNCYNCGHYGHTRERCMATTTDKTTANGQEVPNEPEPTIQHVEKENFGSWMVVEKRGRRSTRRGQSWTNNNNGETSPGLNSEHKDVAANNNGSRRDKGKSVVGSVNGWTRNGPTKNVGHSSLYEPMEYNSKSGVDLARQMHTKLNLKNRVVIFITL
ncbi:hypothetical protein Gotri_000617 [Gossypium trilobum]|uniref:CCHC-type domain-containing protein n=1 Tax=Gossypium trilobum TaxID=34281 RepID=A0A7J9FBW0_9ROSI|nr:hypothetical protein [Gossypium trilobum]